MWRTWPVRAIGCVPNSPASMIASRYLRSTPPHEYRQRHVAHVERTHHSTLRTGRQDRRRKPRLKWPWRFRIGADDACAFLRQTSLLRLALTSGGNDNFVGGLGSICARERQSALIVAQRETAVIDDKISHRKRDAALGIALFPR